MAAKELLETGRATGVKVVKETYDTDTGDYLTLKIFEDGHDHVQLPPEAEDVPDALPCFKPDDLYSYHARATMTRLLSDFLARQSLTVTELIHRADALEQLEATGTTFQHAVQKVAVAQAASTKVPVQKIIKDLNNLTNKAINRVYRDERRNLFPAVNPGKIRALADKLAQDGDGTYVLNGAIAKYLTDASGWDDKMVRLLGLLEKGKGDSPGALLLTKCVDAIAAEVLTGSAGLHELIGAHEDLGDAITTLVYLFLGKARPDKDMRDGMAFLTERFAADSLPDARTAIAGRIMAELKSIKRLASGDLLEEIAVLRRIANKLVLGQGKYLSNEDLIAAFTMRSKRLVSYDTLLRFLEPIVEPGEKIESLLSIEEGVIGGSNKRQLAEVMKGVVTSADFMNYFQDERMDVMERMQTLTALQARVLRTGMQDNQKREVADSFDRLACTLEARAQIIDNIAARRIGSADKAVMLLSLCTKGVLTEGQLSTRVRQIILSCLARPGFIDDYNQLREREEPGLSAEAAKAELLESLKQAGFDAEALPRAIAA
jgi:hypothetical protein